MRDIERWLAADQGGRYAVARARMVDLEAEADRHRMMRHLPRRRPHGRVRLAFGTLLVRLGTTLASSAGPAGQRRWRATSGG